MKALVVGAGPAGLGAALQLATWCDHVVVIDAQPRITESRAGEHLSPSALSSLAQIGLSEILNDPAHTVSSGVTSSWGHTDVTERDYFFSPAGHGINLRRDIFDEALYKRCEQCGVQIDFDTRLSRLERAHNGYQATIRGPLGISHIDSDIVLDASGRNARAARQLGASLSREDNLVGIVGRVMCSKPTQEAGRLSIQSAQDGWWYTIQFSDGLLIATYMTDASTVKEHGAHKLWHVRLSDLCVLEQHAASADWRTSAPESISVFDASTQSLGKMTSTHFLAVGDAAAAFDPLSSWGITKGILDGFEGANALERQVGGEPLAAINHRLKQYQEFQQYRENRKIIYCAEQRWPESPFWRARQTSPEFH